ncbi:hypothetical protein BpHYR1_026892 [Brachionus plicatilis]|uniref:Uncharacterized protein n=1 Tax=Brachionus plicatilis TaxID=10195 RepID=A0A3M7T8Q4_BRAPC|nr:hypothetical protein BpHYR1_026892 [Brachionus plicatilis]
MISVEEFYVSPKFQPQPELDVIYSNLIKSSLDLLSPRSFSVSNLINQDKNCALCPLNAIKTSVWSR